MDILDTRQFWLRYLAAGTEFSDRQLREEAYLDDCEESTLVRIHYGDRFRLEISVDGDHRLQLVDNAQDLAIDLGWMDCHQMSDAFRFEELSSICNAGDLRPLWKSRILFAHYVAPVNETVDELVDTLFRSLCESNLFSTSESRGIANYMKRVVRKDFQWEFVPPLGWIGSIIDPISAPWAFPYTMRTRENTGFNFIAFNDFLTFCENTQNENSNPMDVRTGNGLKTSGSDSHPSSS